MPVGPDRRGRGRSAIATVNNVMGRKALSNRRPWLHRSSPNMALVDHARSFCGAGKTIGLISIYTPIAVAALLLRGQKGMVISGVDAQRDHALRGFECRAETQRLSRVGPLCLGSKWRSVQSHMSIRQFVRSAGVSSADREIGVGLRPRGLRRLNCAPEGVPARLPAGPSQRCANHRLG